MNPLHFYKPIDLDRRPLFKPLDVQFIPLDEETSQLQKLVFAGDSTTGNPVSDVTYLLSGADEGFKQFIKDKLLSAQPQMPMAETADEAQQLVRHNLMTASQYEEYCRDYVIRLQQQEVESEE